MLLSSSAICFVLGLFIDLSIIGGLLVFLGLALGAIVLVGAKFLHPYLRRKEFQVVVKTNQKFMKMFGLIAEGILTKEEFKQKFEEHIEWLRPLDQVHRATGGFEAAIKFMTSTNNSNLLETFWESASDLDWSRDERIISVVPELARLLTYKPKHTRV